MPMAKGVFRAKSQKIRRNFKIGDIVHLKNNTIRNQWPMAKVIDVYKDNDGHVEQSNYMLEIKNLVRPIRKIQLFFRKR